MAVGPGRRARPHFPKGRLRARQEPRAPGHQAQHFGRSPAGRPSPQPVGQRRPLVGKVRSVSTRAQTPSRGDTAFLSPRSPPWRRCWRRSRASELRCRRRSSASRPWRTCCASWWTARTNWHGARGCRTEPRAALGPAPPRLARLASPRRGFSVLGRSERGDLPLSGVLDTRTVHRCPHTSRPASGSTCVFGDAPELALRGTGPRGRGLGPASSERECP